MAAQCPTVIAPYGLAVWSGNKAAAEAAQVRTAVLPGLRQFAVPETCPSLAHRQTVVGRLTNLAQSGACGLCIQAGMSRWACSTRQTSMRSGRST